MTAKLKDVVLIELLKLKTIFLTVKAELIS